MPQNDSTPGSLSPLTPLSNSSFEPGTDPSSQLHQGKLNQAISAVRNRRLVMELLWRRQPLSRRELSLISGLRESALTYIVRELIEKDLIAPVGKKSSSNLGPKHNLLRINAKRGCVMGVAVATDHVDLMVLDLAGDPVVAQQIDRKVERIEELPQILHEQIVAWRSDALMAGRRILGVGVGISGSVDPHRGVILLSNIFKCRDVPLGELLFRKLGITAVVDHDANMAAIAEVRHGRCKAQTHFLYLLINKVVIDSRSGRSAIGGALYLNGLYRGLHFAAGEIDESMIDAALPLASEAEARLLAEPEGDVPERLLQWAAELGAALARLVNFIDPGAVVLGGSLPIANRSFIGALTKRMNKGLIPLHHGGSIEVIPSAFGQSGVERGAAVSAAERLLFHELLN